MPCLKTQASTCCLAGYWNTWCLGVESSSCGNNLIPPSADAWNSAHAHGRKTPVLIPAAPSGHGPCTQTPGKMHLMHKNKYRFKSLKNDMQAENEDVSGKSEQMFPIAHISNKTLRATNCKRRRMAYYETRPMFTTKTESLHANMQMHINRPLSFLKSSASCLSVTISFMLTTLRWFSCLRILISLMAVMGKPSFSLSNRTFFNATSSPLKTKT